MTSCTACQAAERNPHCGHFNSNCDDCTVRAVALSPQHFAAKKAGTITPGYRSLLDAVFGEKWHDGHLRVKAWAPSGGRST